MNKLFVLSVLLFGLISFVISLEQKDVQTAFVQFMRKYNKKYSSSEEFYRRLNNFKATMERVAEKNAKSRKAVYGITKFSDLSPEEFQTNFLMKNPIQVDKKPRDKNRVLPTKLKNEDLPASFDWRQHGAVTPVKDQKQCGSCWAFSVTENIESMWILAKKATNSTVNLSPQQIVDCDTNDGGCNGGNTPTAYEYVISAGGQEPESSYPYTAEDGNCRFDKSDVVAKITNWQWATEIYSETEVQNNLVGWGPLSVCVDASSWQDYVSGIMTWEECAYINVLDHCVQLVGYNATNADNSYWIVRNSWNTDWGIEGYIWLEMWEDTCGITYEASSSIV
jgi:cathepsin F